MFYLYLKVGQAERRPEQGAEVRYGGHFPPRLDLRYRYNGTSLGHFRSGGREKNVKLCSSSNVFHK